VEFDLLVLRETVDEVRVTDGQRVVPWRHVFDPLVSLRIETEPGGCRLQPRAGDTTVELSP
jgi:hypothetical protein